MKPRASNNLKPFGIEFLETPQIPARGTQTVTGPEDGCCRTYTSEIIGLHLTPGIDVPDGGAFCDDTDLCVAS